MLGYGLIAYSVYLATKISKIYRIHKYTRRFFAFFIYARLFSYFFT